jgi:hypothetical protein
MAAIWQLACVEGFYLHFGPVADMENADPETRPARENGFS